jgi:hypothetical protein
MFDKMRERDYQNDIEATKCAWIDGMDTYFRDKNGKARYFSLDVNEHLARDYQIMVKNSAQETEKRDQLRSWAFSAAQNGDIEIAAEAIESNSTPQLVSAIKRFGDIKRQHETELEQQKQQLEEMKQQFALDVIHAKGEEDRQTEIVKGMIAADEQANEIDARLMEMVNSVGATGNDNAAIDSKERIEQAKLSIEERKLQATQYANQAKMALEGSKLGLENKRIAADIKIARMNKNKYDK